MTPSSQPPIIDIQNIEGLPTIVAKRHTDILASTLDKECRVYTRYLTSQEPNEYVLEKYYQAHIVSEEIAKHPVSQFEELLLRLSRINPLITRAADIYTSYLLKDSIFRKKIILLLAILESCSPSYEFFDAPDQMGLVALTIRGFYFSLAFLISAITSLLIFTPLHLAMATSRALSWKAKNE